MKSKIVLIDDNSYEADLLTYSLAQLNYNYVVKFFSKPQEAYRYLTATEDPVFLIISDMNMPKLNGLELRKKIDSNKKLKKKSIPFIFFSSTEAEDEIAEAYEYGVHGYFKKPEDRKEAKEILEIIIKYWQRCRHPNKPE